MSSTFPRAGKLGGSVTQSGVLSFKGVPYAEVGERFVPAHEVAKWDGIRSATEYGKISSQMEFRSTNMVSDEVSGNNCQNLNIWTPASRRTIMSDENVKAKSDIWNVKK